MWARRAALLLVAWTIWRRKDSAPKPEPSLSVLRETCMSERIQQSTAAGALNGIAAALLGFEAVLGTVGISIKSCPNWKGAALSVLALSIVFALLTLADVILPWRNGLWMFDPQKLGEHVNRSLRDTELTLFATAAAMFIAGDQEVIKPKRRSLRLSIICLVLALILGGIGVGAKGK